MSRPQGRATVCKTEQVLVKFVNQADLLTVLTAKGKGESISTIKSALLSKQKKL